MLKTAADLSLPLQKNHPTEVEECEGSAHNMA